MFFAAQGMHKEKFYGRRKAKPLNMNQAKLFEELLPQLKIGSWKEVESLGYSELALEIGFGGGEHLAAQAEMIPDTLFIGGDPFVNGVGSLLEYIDKLNLKNVRVFPDDARDLIDNVPAGSFNEVFLLFPDPWPKRRHFQRRFVNEENIKKIHRILKPKGVWKIATDHIDYAKWILKHVDDADALFSKKVFRKENRPSEETWPKTRYELKSDSGDILYLLLEKK